MIAFFALSLSSALPWWLAANEDDAAVASAASTVDHVRWPLPAGTVAEYGALPVVAVNGSDASSAWPSLVGIRWLNADHLKDRLPHGQLPRVRWRRASPVFAYYNFNKPLPVKYGSQADIQPPEYLASVDAETLLAGIADGWLSGGSMRAALRTSFGDELGRTIAHALFGPCPGAEENATACHLAESWAYASCDLADVPQLQRDLPLHLPDFQLLRVNSTDPAFFNANLWISSRGSVAHMHYDAFHNFFVQMYGYKEFILAPPAAHRRLRVFPSTHPRYRQTQLLYPPRGTPGVRRVVLAPGDVLYLPPMWFHRVRSLTRSVSMNVWSDSDVREAEAKLPRTLLPLDENAPVELRIAPGACIIRELLLAHNLTAADVRRYDAPSIVQTTTFNAGFLDAVRDFCPPDAAKCADRHEGKLRAVRERLIPIFERILDADMRELALHNYIDKLVQWIVGGQAGYHRELLAQCAMRLDA